MNEIDELERQVRYWEGENRKLRLGLWDEYFKAALSGLSSVAGSDPKKIVERAALIADEAAALRFAPEGNGAKLRQVRGELGVAVSFIDDAMRVIETIEGDDADERERLQLLVEKMDRFVCAVKVGL